MGSDSFIGEVTHELNVVGEGDGGGGEEKDLWLSLEGRVGDEKEKSRGEIHLSWVVSDDADDLKIQLAGGQMKIVDVTQEERDKRGWCGVVANTHTRARNTYPPFLSLSLSLPPSLPFPQHKSNIG